MTTDRGLLETIKDLLANGITVRRRFKNTESAVIQVVDITTAGTAQQFPDIAVPDGFALTVRARPNNTNAVFLGLSKPDAEGRHRIRLDVGDAVSFYVRNANIFWGDVTTSGESFEIFVEREQAI